LRLFNKYISSNNKLLDIRIKYKREVFKFNLYEELKVDENKINSELKNQPSYYGFVGMLLIKLQRVKDDKEAEFYKKEAELYIEYKTSINPNTNRENSKELAEALVKENPAYQKLLKEFNNAKENVGIIKHCLSSFEQRSNLIQSLSANLRKEV